MKIINHTKYQVEALPFIRPDGQAILTLIVKATFTITQNSTARLADEQIPVSFADELYGSEKGGGVKYEADTAPFKPRSDIVLIGKAYAPGGRHAQSFDAGLRVGALSKSIRIFGDRAWSYTKKFLSSSVSMSFAHPVTEMDIVYEKAFGGMDKTSGGRCEENPAGKGYLDRKPEKILKTIDGTPLPNIEDPKNVITNYYDHPKPAGFGFYGKTWLPRIKYLGSYNEKWQKDRCPSPPEDFRFDFYNAAHPDLQVNGYLKGDEDVVLLNFTPDGEIKFKLPGIRPVSKVIKRDWPETKTWEEQIAMNLDTLCLIPDEKRFFQVWRGICPIKDLSALEIKQVEFSI
ncbi:MAG: DUF2169 domain-containing protein [Nitrospirae bacterium]|nr:DUF2169 domain-containing protein [Nitrospirota bacterium]